MKKTKLILLFALICNHILSQNEFQKAWETKVDVKNKWNSCNEDLSMIIIGDLKEFAMVDGISGKQLWKFSAQERLGIKTLEDWTFLWAKENEPVEVIYKKTKESNTTTIYLDSKTGQITSITENELKDKNVNKQKKRGKTKFATYVFDESSSTFIELMYKDKLVKSTKSGSEFDLIIKASGGNNWTANIKAKVITHLNRLLLPSDEPSLIMNMMVKNNKVFIIHEGITVLDLKTGNFLWNTSYDMVQGGLTSQEIGRSPLPVVDDEAMYLVDFSKGEKAIKKINIQNGEVIWKSEKISGNDVISELFIMNNTLIAKYGGYIRKAKSIYNPNSGATTQKAKIEYEGKSDIVGYNVTTGKQVWIASEIFGNDKISNSECNIYLDNNNLIACSVKNLYILEANNGKILHKAELGKEIGNPEYVFVYNGNYIIEGDKGIASFSKNGTKNYAIATGKTLLTEFIGNAFIIWTGKSDEDMNEFISMDLSNGKITGKLKGCYYPRFNTDGDYFIRFNEQTITKYKTK